MAEIEIPWIIGVRASRRLEDSLPQPLAVATAAKIARILKVEGLPCRRAVAVDAALRRKK